MRQTDGKRNQQKRKRAIPQAKQWWLELEKAGT
jgi:hypothetical protein